MLWNNSVSQKVFFFFFSFLCQLLGSLSFPPTTWHSFSGFLIHMVCFIGFFHPFFVFFFPMRRKWIPVTFKTALPFPLVQAVGCHRDHTQSGDQGIKVSLRVAIRLLPGTVSLGQVDIKWSVALTSFPLLSQCLCSCNKKCTVRMLIIPCYHPDLTGAHTGLFF